MADTIPLNIPVPATQAIASFDFFDLVNGTGVVKLYGAEQRGDGAASYYLTTNENTYSNNIVLSGAVVAAGTTTRVFTTNFDIEFNRTLNVKGMAYLNVTIGGHSNGGTGTSTLFLSGATLSNSTTGVTLATQGSMETINLTIPATGTSKAKVMNIPFDLTGGPYTISVGDVLRLNLQLWGNTTGTDSIDYGGIGIDPKARTDVRASVNAAATISGGNAVTTQMILNLPVLNNQ